MRSAFAMLGRRSFGSAASSAAATMAGRGREIRQVFRPTAPPLPSIRPPARNLESWRHFSTGGREPAENARIGLLAWLKQYIARIKNGDVEATTNFKILVGVGSLGTSTKIAIDLQRKRK
ncbi:hypothetical protein ACP70R_030588 [Stipagrostis hirtigluma subsp. patula]